MFEKILIVCVGNICRSPTAERILRDIMPNKTIDSAGISAVVGHGANELAKEVAIQHGVDLDNHQARQLTNEMCQAYHLILVMEQPHIAAVCEIAPEARGKVMLLGHWLNQQEIADPFRRSEEMYQHVFKLIHKAAHSWLEKL